MKFSLPVLVQQTIESGESSYSARPLFQSEPVISGALLDRVLAKLRSAIRKEMNRLAQDHRLEDFSDYVFHPNLYDKSFSLEIHHKKRTIKGNFLTVVLPDQEPRIAFCPELPQVWFQVSRGENLKTKLIDVLDHYFRKGPGKDVAPKSSGKSWVSEVEVDFRVPNCPPKKKQDPNKMILGGPPVNPGWLELERVGRCFDDLYPHDLNRCLCRDTEVERLERNIHKPTRASQLVVGAKKVGKTTLIHEIVRRSHQRKNAQARKYWLLSPQRLISGMSYVGQWESRLLSILKYAQDKDVVLVFDDLLGLFSAGVSRDSNLCVADVLKPFMQRKEVRILGECTPESLAILRERDRGFADLFTLHQLRESSERQTLKIALEEIRVSERLHSCQFEVSALTAAMDVQRRYIRDAAFPGKVAAFLRRVAARYQKKTDIDDETIRQYFNTVSGIDNRFLNDESQLSRGEVRRQLQEQIMGQSDAVDAAVDAVLMFKSRLCDPSRPIASLLFVGPTGVGKTECAKALSRYLFNDEARLLRFDMNEFVNPGSAARLVGTFHQPDGLLTSAVRRQPFCVLLLDEIEKAHQEVFNLLLQLLGDGRLTDARGRTVDFTQAIVVMTSNLGVREAGKPMGLRSKSSEESLTYRRAVEKFFPPEFFNRLDKIVPFQRLSREDTTTLARRILGKVLSREGLVRRQCILNVSADAMEKIVDLGYHPELGARALKRSIEQSISGPVSERLTEMNPLAPTIITITGAETLEVSVQELQAAETLLQSSVELLDLAQLDQMESWFAALEERLQSDSPEGLVDEQLTSPQYWYYETQDRLRRSRAISQRLRHYLSQETPPKRPVESSHRLLQAQSWQQLLNSSALGQALRELSSRIASSSEVRRLHGKLAELQGELALLSHQSQEQKACLRFIFTPAVHEHARKLFTLYKKTLEEMDYEVSGKLGEADGELSIFGPRAEALAESESGFHLFSHDKGLAVLDVSSESSRASERRVVRAYDLTHGTLDLRTGWFCPEHPTTEEMRLLVLSALPLNSLEVERASS